MSPEAERLCEVIWAVPTWVSSDPAKQKEYNHLKTKGIAQAIVTELGITEEMVECLKCPNPEHCDPGDDLCYQDHRCECWAPRTAADTLATLLEVAGNG